MINTRRGQHINGGPYSCASGGMVCPSSYASSLVRSCFFLSRMLGWCIEVNDIHLSLLVDKGRRKHSFVFASSFPFYWVFLSYFVFISFLLGDVVVWKQELGFIVLVYWGCRFNGQAVGNQVAWHGLDFYSAVSVDNPFRNQLQTIEYINYQYHEQLRKPEVDCWSYIKDIQQSFLV